MRISFNLIRISLYLMLACAVITSCTYEKAHIEFKKIAHNFHVVKQGGRCNYKFEFINSGNEPLIVKEVKASCFCTTPEWTTDTIKTKEKGYINVEYNSEIIGSFDKTITVYSNATNSPSILRITGVIEASDN